jgi:hypothetical protein
MIARFVAVTLSLAFVLAVAQPASSVSRGAGAAGPSTDILLAFDTTGSMAPSIATAKRDANAIVASVSAFSPDARFAVASFRDRFYPGGSYSLLTPMTGSSSALVNAVGRLQAVGTQNASKDTPAEAYNLLFHETYSDARIGWRPGARKIVVVIGDAEPHSAGADGIAGCSDRTPDWDGLSTSHELAAMRAARRTLVMIRQPETASASLGCYASLASLAYEGGSARNGGGADIATPVLSLVKQTYAPLVVMPQLSYGVAGKTDGVTVRVANPNNFPLQVDGLSLRLPPGVTVATRASSGNLPRATVAGGMLSWNVATPISPYGVLAGHLVLRLSPSARGSFFARMTSKLPNGEPFTTSATSAIRVVRTPRRMTLSVSANGSSARSITGAFSVRLGARGAGTNSGRIIVRNGVSRSVTLRALTAAASPQGAPTRVGMRVVVVARKGLPLCRAGTTGQLQVLDSDVLAKTGRTADRVKVTLPSTCGGVRAFADSDTSGRTEVKLGFH